MSASAPNAAPNSEAVREYGAELESFFEKRIQDAERWALARRIAFGATAFVAAIALVAVPTTEQRVIVLIGMAILLLALLAIWPALTSKASQDAIVPHDSQGKPRLAIGVLSDGSSGIYLRGSQPGQSVSLFSGANAAGLRAHPGSSDSC